MRDKYEKYFKLSWPMALQGLFLNLTTLVDLAMVGKLGINSVAAIGISSQPKMILNILATGLASGVVAVGGRRIGEGEKEGANNIFSLVLLFTSLVYLVFCSVNFFFSKEILLFAGAKLDYLQLADDYFKYIVISRYFIALKIIMTAGALMIGNSQIVFRANVIGNIANLVFNYLLIFGKFGFPTLGIKGAGIGTLIGEGLIVVALGYCLHKSGVSINSGKGIFADYKSVAKISGNSILEQIFERIGMFLFTRMIAELGAVATATSHIVMIAVDVVYYIFMGMGQASSSITGRVLGEGNKKELKEYIKVFKNSGILAGVIATFIFIFLRRPIFTMLSGDPNALALGDKVMMIAALSMVQQALAQIFSGALRGASDTAYVAKYSLIIIAFVRPMLTYLFTFKFNLGLSGAWLAFLVDQSLRMLASTTRTRTDKWLSHKV